MDNMKMDIPAAQAAIKKVIAIHDKHMALPAGQAPSDESEQAEMDLLKSIAEALGVGKPMKAGAPSMGKSAALVKAQDLDPDDQAAWFAGKVPRRLLAIPFGGPIPRPGAPRGVDYDNEFFSEKTDIFGGVRALKQTRDRLTDFSHAYAAPDKRYGDPTGMMTGHIIGKSILDPDPEEDGWWVDFWFNVGDKRVKMIEALARRGAQLFGSSQPVPGKTQRDDNGEITVWPFLFETLSPAPSNTHSAFLPAKAMLEEADITGIAISSQMRMLLAEMRDLDADLRRSSAMGDDGAKAGRELSSANDDEIEAALVELGAANSRLSNLLERVRARYRKSEATE